MVSIADEFGYTSAFLVFIFNVSLPHVGLRRFVFCHVDRLFFGVSTALGRYLFLILQSEKTTQICLPFELFFCPFLCRFCASLLFSQFWRLEV